MSKKWHGLHHLVVFLLKLVAFILLATGAPLLVDRTTATALDLAGGTLLQNARARASMVAISRPGFRVRATLRWRELDSSFGSGREWSSSPINVDLPPLEHPEMTTNRSTLLLQSTHCWPISPFVSRHANEQVTPPRRHSH
jgi:hypothetical protein